jgi:maltose O-acetyltransferase
LAQSFYFNGPETTLAGDGKITIGPDSYIGRNSGISAVDGYTIRIGEGCAISHYITVYTQSRVADQDLSTPEKEYKRGDVVIGDYTWIGYRVFVTPDVEIGKHAMIGAHSVVTRDIPPYSIATGSPAKVRSFKRWVSEEEQIEIALKYEDVIGEELAEELGL